MSGGAFDYFQSHYGWEEAIERIESCVENKRDYYDDGDDVYAGEKLAEETIQEFDKALDCIKKAQVYFKRLDYFFSGDDSEESFHESLKQDLSNL